MVCLLFNAFSPSLHKLPDALRKESFWLSSSTLTESRKCFKRAIVFRFQFPFRFCCNVIPHYRFSSTESVEFSALNLKCFINNTFIFCSANVHYNVVYTSLNFNMFIFFRGFEVRKKLHEATSITKLSLSIRDAMSFMSQSVRT